MYSISRTHYGSGHGRSIIIRLRWRGEDDSEATIRFYHEAAPDVKLQSPYNSADPLYYVAYAAFLLEVSRTLMGG